MELDKNERKVLEALKLAEKPQTTSRISVATNIHFYNVPDTLDKLVKKKLVKQKRIARYKYEITPEGLELVE